LPEGVKELLAGVVKFTMDEILVELAPTQFLETEHETYYNAFSASGFSIKGIRASELSPQSHRITSTLPLHPQTIIIHAVL
jgi:hypothetical protein